MGTLDKIIEENQKNDAYWIEEAKLDFAFSLEDQRRRSGLTYSAVAQNLGVTKAYVSKVFRGDTNLTIESMVKLARAVGGRLTIQVEPPATILSFASPAFYVGGNPKGFVSESATAETQQGFPGMAA